MFGIAAKLVGEKFARPLVYGIGIILLLVMFYLALDAYGDSRFREGRAAENAAWKKAQDVLIAQAAKSSKKADTEALAATLDQAAKTQEEKEKVDDAIANGSSPFDVLFPSGSVPAR